MVKRAPTKAAPKPRTKRKPKPAFDYGRCDFVLAIVKGLVEHDDGGAYFGSLMGYRGHEAEGIERGLLTRGPKECDGGGGHMFVIEATRLTDAGRAAYAAFRLDFFPKTYGRRAYMWDWSPSLRGL